MAVFLVFGSTQCSGTKGLTGSGNSRTYEENFKIINNYFQQIIEHSALLVDKVISKGTKRIFVVSQSGSYSRDYTHYTRTQVGRVIIKAVSPVKTVVTVENPEYPFGFPEFKKEDYQRIIFSGLEELIKKENDDS